MWPPFLFSELQMSEREEPVELSEVAAGDLTEELRKELTIHFVQSVDEVLLLALTPAAKATGDKKNRVQPRVQ